MYGLKTNFKHKEIHLVDLSKLTNINNFNLFLLQSIKRIIRRIKYEYIWLILVRRACKNLYTHVGMFQNNEDLAKKIQELPLKNSVLS